MGYFHDSDADASEDERDGRDARRASGRATSVTRREAMDAMDGFLLQFNQNDDDDDDDAVVDALRKILRRDGNDVERISRMIRREAREARAMAPRSSGEARRDAATASEALANARRKSRAMAREIENGLRMREQFTNEATMETMRARAYEVGFKAAKFRLELSRAAKSLRDAQRAGEHETVCASLREMRRQLEVWRKHDGERLSADAVRTMLEATMADAEASVEAEIKRAITSWCAAARVVAREVARELIAGSDFDAAMMKYRDALDPSSCARARVLCVRLFGDDETAFATCLREVRRAQLSVDVVSKSSANALLKSGHSKRAPNATTDEMELTLGHFAIQIFAIGAFPGALSRSEVETEWKELAATLRNNILSSDRNEIASVVERTRAVCNVIQTALGFPVENLTDAASALETIARPREDADDE